LALSTDKSLRRRNRASSNARTATRSISGVLYRMVSTAASPRAVMYRRLGRLK